MDKPRCVSGKAGDTGETRRLHFESEKPCQARLDNYVVGIRTIKEIQDLVKHENFSSKKYLSVKGGRTIAYTEAGDPNSCILVISFHGFFTIGTARAIPTLSDRSIHFLDPTLPGWGETSPVPPDSTFVSCLLEDMTALITHLHPDTSQLSIYVGGGSYGSVPPQILQGAPYDVFPIGRRIVGMLFMSGFSSFRLDTNYRKSLKWSDYIGAGPIAYYSPYRIVPRLIRWFFSFKMSSVDEAEKFLRTSLFDKMDDAESQRVTNFCTQNGSTKDKMIRDWAETCVKSVENSWDGFLSLSKVLNEDWGFSLPLDEEHSRCKVIVVVSTKDTLGKGMAEFVARSHPNSQLKVVEGGHIGALPHINSFWKELLD